MTDTPGSHKLEPEQQQWFIEKRGVRYTHVATAEHGFLNRKTRRRLAKQAKRS